MRLSEIVSAWWFIITALVGGIVAHIRDHEVSGKELTAAQHFWGIVRRSVMGGFGGLLVYYAWKGAGWPESFGFFTAGVVGLFSVQAFEFMGRVVKQVIENKIAMRSGPITDRHNPMYPTDRDKGGRQ